MTRTHTLAWTKNPPKKADYYCTAIKIAPLCCMRSILWAMATGKHGIGIRDD